MPEEDAEGTYRRLIGLCLACAGLLAAAVIDSPTAVLVGGLLWAGLPAYWLAKNVGPQGTEA